MRLRALKVTDFGAVESADVTFEDGLNVLHGPNDLGKSTLAAAVRAALLLQHGSSAARPFVPWGTTRKPQVTLTFEADGRWWRVHKAFGTSSGGKSVLEWSNDGVTFNLEEEGRGVDGRLRDLLGWGLAKPGGRGGSHGFPKSFLATVLLGEQALPYRLLEQSLDADVEDSGKARLIEALQAMATDPVYQHVLEEAQARVDQAFTAKGKRSTRKGSPFERVAADIAQRRASSEELTAAVADSDAVVSRLAELAARRDASTATKLEAAARMGRLEDALAQRQARAALQAEVDAATDALDQIQRNGEEIARLQTELRAAEAAVPEASAAVDVAVQTVRQAQAQRDRALAEHEARAGGDDAQLRAEQAAWDEAMRAVEADEASLRVERTQLQAWTQAADAQTEARSKASVASEQASAAQASASAAHAEAEAAQQRHRGLTDALRWARAEALQSRCETLENQAQATEAARAEAASKRADAATIRGALQSDFPEASQREAMETAWRHLEVKRASLQGGLRVTLALGEDVGAQAQIDGASAHSVDAQAQIDAEREVVLDLGRAGSVTMQAGAPDAHVAVDEARAAWAPHAAALERLGLASMDALREAAKAHDEQLRRSDALLAEAKVLEARATEVDPQVRVSLQRELEAATRGLNALDAVKSRALADEHGEDLEATAREADAESDRLRVAAATAKSHAAEASTQAQLAAERAEAATVRLEALRVGGGENDPALAAETLEARVAAVASRRAELEASAAARSDAAAQRVEAAKAARDEAESALGTAVEREAEARRALQAARDAKASALAALEVRRERAQHHDPLQAAERVAKAEDALVAHPLPELDVSDDTLGHARTALREAEEALEDAERAVRQQEGALQHVGGQVVRERAQMAREALEEALRQEAEVALDYEGWRLLLGTLREVENQTGAHLGRALGSEVAERMASLSRGRYQGAALGADLETEGVVTSRGVQALDRFSEGVKEQVATLLRVSVAEHLGTMLVLDDHLAQTDPGRAAWFRRLLHESAQKVQVIVLTCRPSDYMDDGDDPAHVIALADHVLRQT